MTPIFNESHLVQTRGHVVPKCAPVFVVVRRWRSSRFCFIVYNKTISVFRKLEIIVPVCINVVLFNFLDKKFFRLCAFFYTVFQLNTKTACSLVWKWFAYKSKICTVFERTNVLFLQSLQLCLIRLNVLKKIRLRLLYIFCKLLFFRPS